MPIYEYICLKCKRRSSYLIRHRNDVKNLRCTHCEVGQLQRIMSRFSAIQSEESRLESIADISKWTGLDESDPSSVAKFVKKMGSELGEDISRDEIDQMADEAAHEAETGFNGDAESSCDSID